MAEIKPFKAVKYNLEKVDIKNVVAPPYDVISKSSQEDLYNKSDFNIVRIILGKDFDNDDEKNNKYYSQSPRKNITIRI